VKRLEFSLWMEAMAEVDRDFVRRILWSDEAHFYRSGTVSRHNCRYWSDQNPHWVDIQFPGKNNSLPVVISYCLTQF